MKNTSFMKHGATIAATVLGLGALAASPAIAQDQSEAEAAEQTEPTKGEKRLAKLLEGRVAGEPQTCIRKVRKIPLTVIDKTAYVYGRGKTIYVQRTQNPDDISRKDTLVSQRFDAAQLCRLDVLTTVDPVLGVFTGAVFFDDFIPYTRVEDAEEAG